MISFSVSKIIFSSKFDIGAGFKLSDVFDKNNIEIYKRSKDHHLREIARKTGVPLEVGHLNSHNVFPLEVCLFYTINVFPLEVGLFYTIKVFPLEVGHLYSHNVFYSEVGQSFEGILKYLQIIQESWRSKLVCYVGRKIGF